MFEFKTINPFFNKFDEEHTSLVQDIEIIFENKLQVDSSYHSPKQFIRSVNNLIRSVADFCECSVKNKDKWLMQSVKDYTAINHTSYQILVNLRNTCCHQHLIMPKESLVSGLYRIRSDSEYVMKIGMGDHSAPGDYSHSYAMRDTLDIFRELLVFNSMTFMDLEHSALNECLGITRRWFYHAKFKNRHFEHDSTIDLYNLVTDFACGIIDGVCEGYAKINNFDFSTFFSCDISDHNYINTLLEVDLYPTLFTSWWEEDIHPLNYGVMVDIGNGKIYQDLDQVYAAEFRVLSNTPEAYKTMLDRALALSIENFKEPEKAKEVIGFLFMNHWHYKAAFESLGYLSQISPAEILKIQLHTKLLVEELNIGKLCVISQAFDQLKQQLARVRCLI